MLIGVIGSGWTYLNLDLEHENSWLIWLGTMGIALGVWRSTIAEHQADVAQRGLRNDQFFRAVEMLDSANRHTRIGAIHALQSLAEEYPKEFGANILIVLIEFAQWAKADPTSDNGKFILGNPEFVLAHQVTYRVADVLIREKAIAPMALDNIKHRLDVMWGKKREPQSD